MDRCDPALGTRGLVGIREGRRRAGLTCHQLSQDLVVAVDHVDGHISGGLQEERVTLREEEEGTSSSSVI